MLVVRPSGSPARPSGAPAQWVTHDGDILFTFVMAGEMTLEGQGKDPCRLSPGDAFVVPPGMATRYADPSGDLELLEVALPGQFSTVPGKTDVRAQIPPLGAAG